MAVFLYAPQDFRNLCALARTLDVFGQQECHVYDPYRLIRARYGKARARMMRDVSSGAFERIRWLVVPDPLGSLQQPGRRVVATLAETGASPLADFRFAPTDMLLFGSESRGLPAEIAGVATDSVTIPSRGATQSLNLAVAFGMVLFEWHRQTQVLV